LIKSGFKRKIKLWRQERGFARLPFVRPILLKKLANDEREKVVKEQKKFFKNSQIQGGDRQKIRHHSMIPLSYGENYGGGDGL